MSAGELTQHSEKLNAIGHGFKNTPSNHNKYVKHLDMYFEVDYIRPILRSLNVDQRSRKKEIEHTLRIAKDEWITTKHITDETWNTLQYLLFPPE